MTRVLMGTAVFMAGILGPWIMTSGDLGSLLNPMAATLVCGITLGAILMSYGVTKPLSQLLQVLRAPQSAREAEPRELIGALKVVILVAPLAGLIACILGLIHVMQNLSDPSKLGAGVAVAFLGLLYGAIDAALAYGLLGHVESVTGDEQGTSTDMNELATSSLYTGLGFFILFGAFFVILYAIEASTGAAS
ncbi:MAG: MotA/TolQ/ExbB proton channel family protein [Myxococcota bacterium]|nr:MotA/TolQ/ExbB proton channel family protein [Myxococcota bacterium]